MDTRIAARDCRPTGLFREWVRDANGLGPRIVRDQASQDEYHGLYEKKIWGATRKTISKSREAPQLTFRVIRGLILLSVESVLFVLACHGSTTQVRSAECSCRPGAAVHDSASASRGTCRPSPAETPTKSAITSVPVTIRVGLSVRRPEINQSFDRSHGCPPHHGWTSPARTGWAKTVPDLIY